LFVGPIDSASVNRALQLTAALLIGMLIGGALLVLQTGHRIERLHIQQGQLVSQLQWYRARVEKLSEQLSVERWVVVEEVNLSLKGVEPSSGEELYLREQLAPYMQKLLGRRVVDLDPELVLGMFDGRVLEHEQMRYTVRVQTMVLARVARVVVDITAEKVNRRDRSE